MEGSCDSTLLDHVEIVVEGDKEETGGHREEVEGGEPPEEAEVSVCVCLEGRDECIYVGVSDLGKEVETTILHYIYM